MASSACFLHHHAISSSGSGSRRQSVSIKPAGVVVCRAQKQEADVVADATVSRRLALDVVIGAAAIGSKVSPANAAYGEAANVFGKPKTDTDFLAYNGEGFKLEIPAKWNPSKEVEYPGQVLRYEDNFDSTSNLAVTVNPTDKKPITDFGSPEEFLSKVDFLLGRQAYFGIGSTDSEGANVLESSTTTVGGKPYYNLSVLTRTADTS